MKIKTITIVEPKDDNSWVMPRKKGDVREIRSMDEIYCCDDMKNAIGTTEFITIVQFI